MSVHCSLTSCSPLKTIFGKIGDTYLAYCHTYKTHAMGNHHGGSGSTLDRDIDMTRKTQTTIETDVEDTQDFHPIETDHFEDLEHNSPTKLTALTRELDDLCQWVQPGEGQPMETLNHIEHKLQRLYISQSTITHWTPWRGDETLHEHSVFCSKTKQPDKLLATGYTCI